MSAKFEKLEGNQGVLTVEVEVEKVNESLDAAFKKVVQQVNVPGFRKGKMPRPLFEKRFGVESLYQDAIDINASRSIYSCNRRNRNRTG